MASTISTLDPFVLSALEAVVDALRPIAEYTLEPRLEERMHELGGNKERCSDKEREEYMAWAEFWRRRTRDKLNALHALTQLRNAFPDLEALAGLDEFLPAKS